MTEIRTRRHGTLASGRRSQRRDGARCAAAAVWILVLSGSAALAQAPAAYLYSLSSFSGPLRDDGARVRVDAERDEVLVIYQNTIRVFNRSGMEFYSFGADLDLGQILDLAVEPGGDIVLLSYKDSRSLVTRCNFRGEPLGPIEIGGLPEGLAFHANRMVLRKERFYFASLAASSVIVTDAKGTFLRHVDLPSMMQPEERQRGGTEALGFSVDEEGSIFLTLPSVFRVYKIAEDGGLTEFGRPGAVPGRFGIVAGIAVDRRGNLLVADKLKCVVMLFDKDFGFVGEFGYRGPAPENLIVPEDVAVDRLDRVYVAQGRRRGISVFALAPR